ncbi:MAG: hypothetical protein BRD46_02590 [Bacteroidetes bacterium QS_8_68_15]|nr:MAG: hypothetical protein BRD46_02590 [Bacteroidetes bacterium QS_8_68_15]
MRARPFHLLRRSVLPSTVLLVLIGALAAGPVRAQQQQQKQRTRSTAAPDSGASITYEEAVRLALERNYQLRRAQNDVTSQSISIDRNRAEFYPNLSLSVGGGRDFGRNFSQTQGEIVSQTSSEANVGAQSQVNLFNGFRDDATLDEAQARMQAASGTVQRTRREVAYRVLQRYIALAQNRALVDVRRQQLELRRQQLEQTQAQIEVGEKAPSAVYQIQADVAAARQDLVQARRDADLSQTELVRLLVLDPFGSYTFQTGSLDDRLPTSSARTCTPARPASLPTSRACAPRSRASGRAWTSPSATAATGTASRDAPSRALGRTRMSWKSLPTAAARRSPCPCQAPVAPRRRPRRPFSTNSTRAAAAA